MRMCMCGDLMICFRNFHKLNKPKTKQKKEWKSTAKQLRCKQNTKMRI